MSESSYKDTESGRIEKTALVVYALMDALQRACPPLPAKEGDDDSHIGMLMGIAMYLDDHIGPFRSDRLMAAAPGIILRTDAHVTVQQRRACLPLLRQLGHHLTEIGAAES